MRGIQADIRGDELGDELGDEIAIFHRFLYNSKKYVEFIKLAENELKNSENDFGFYLALLDFKICKFTSFD